MQKPALSQSNYWYESDVLQAILTKRLKQIPELKLVKGKRFLRVGENEIGTFPCDRYPNPQLYVAIGEQTDVGNEKAKFRDHEGNINQDVSYGIDFLSLMGTSNNVVYTVCETLLTHQNFSNWSLQDCQAMFFTQRKDVHHLSESQIRKIQVYKELGGDSCALYDFKLEEFQKIAEIAKTKWEKIEAYDEKLFNKIQQAKDQGKAYEDVLFNPQEIKFLKQLLGSMNQQAFKKLAEKLPNFCQSMQEAQQVLTKAWESDRKPTMFSEVLPLITAKEATTRQARVVLPLYVRNGH